MSKTTANSKKTARPRGKPWPKGTSGNPSGRPKDGESWSAIIANIGNLYPDDVINFIGTDNDLGRMIAKFPKNVQLKYLVVTRVYASLMFEPSQGLLKEFIDRMEGRVKNELDVTSNGQTIGKDNGDLREEILRKLDSIAITTSPPEVSGQSDE